MTRRRFGSPAIGWVAVAALLVCLALISVVIAQTSRRSADLQGATRALIEGRYDEVATLTGALDPGTPAVAALAARALIARGRYAEAEQLLRPIALREPSSEAALELGLLLRMLGRDDAQAVLVKVAARSAARDAAGLAREARALQALGLAQEANAAYREAAAAAPRDPAVHTAWGEFFLERHRSGEALPSFEAALAADPKWGPAVLGSARALLDTNPPQAIALAKQALEINPSDVAAHLFLAARAADADKRDEARESLTKALAINPSSLEAHAFLAGLAYVEDKSDEFEAHVAKTLAIAPRYGEVYRVAGDLTARDYRFEEAAALARRGLALDPNNPQILADLGVHLLRVGDEPGAREVLERSFKGAPYNVVTLNLLRMMDTLDTFATVDAGNVVLRMHKEEVPVLQEATLALAKQALTTLGRRYQVEVKGPILIEVFPKHDDFAVRNVGLPGMIGALGACFGRVVTMDSPRARPPGEFQWEATLWHELAHVVTLQISNQRVPRWLTEGISVYEEKVARPEWARGMELSFAATLNRGETIKLADLNAAFTDPRTISLAYYQASLLVEHLVATFGDAGVRKLLQAFGDGLETDEALKAALGTSFAELQGSFDQKIDREFRDLRAALQAPKGDLLRMPLDQLRMLAKENPRSYPVQVALARALREDGAIDEALEALERAAHLVPNAGGDGPHAQMADIALERKDQRRALVALEGVFASDFNNVGAARQLAAVMREAGVTDAARIRPVYERIVAIDPFDGQAQAVVGRLAMERNDPEAAIRAFRTVLALQPVDRAAAHTDLAESYLRSGRRADARKQTLAALEIAPRYERAQDLLLQITESRP